MKKSGLYLLAFICTWTFAFTACSAQLNPVNVNSEGFAIKGYDTVAYFTKGEPVKGQKEFQYEWQGAKWLFTNKEHLAMFQENPDKFAPQYGGY